MFLHPEERAILERDYQIYMNGLEHAMPSIEGADLLIKDHLDEWLAIVTENYESPSMVVTASLFAKYYSYMILNGGLYILTLHQHQLDLSLENIKLALNENGSLIVILKKNPIRQIRETDVDEALISFILTNLRPLFSTLSMHTGIKQGTLWAHASYALHHLHDQRQGVDLQQITEQVKELQQDFFSMDHPLFPGRKLRLRKECCLRHCLPSAGDGNCTTCPMLTEQERIDSLRAYHSKR